jgi:hypothetical protein
MESSGTTTEADLIDYEDKHPNKRQNPDKKFAASDEELRVIKYPFMQNYEPFKSDEIVTSPEGNDDEACIQRVSCNRNVLLRPTVVRTPSSCGRSGRYPGPSYERKRRAKNRYGATGYSENTGEDAVFDDGEIKGKDVENNDEVPVNDERGGSNIDNVGPKKESQGGTLGEHPLRRPSECKDVITRPLETMKAVNSNQNVEVEEILRTYQHQLPTVSTATSCKNRDSHKLTSARRKDCVNKVKTSRYIRQQRKSPSQFAPHRVAPIIFIRTVGAHQPSSPGVSTANKRVQTAYSRSQLFEMEQELRKDNYFCCPLRVSLATLLNISERQIRTWFRNWKKRKKKTLNDEDGIGISGSKITSISRRDDFTSSIHLHAWTRKNMDLSSAACWLSVFQGACYCNVLVSGS